MSEELATARLAELEAVIEAGLQTFVDVGAALLEIRDGRLYRQTHETFEAYLGERWGMGRAHGYRLIDGARVAELVSPMGDIPAERQARELVPLLDDPDQLRLAWAEAIANGAPTAAKVREAVERRRPVVPIEPVEPADVTDFHADTERVCPTCHGTGWVPIDVKEE